jgi:glycerol-3-phosphate acyltransferase PlsY
MLKGLIPVLLVQQFSSDFLLIALTGLFALLGHIFPLYYGFKGGKGVATYYGVLLGFSWLSGLIALGIWLLIAALLKISSLSALISIFSASFILFYSTESVELTTALVVMSMLVFWRHKKNITQLLQGNEVKIGKSTK